MVPEPLPRSLKRAIEKLEGEPERPWRLCDLASVCGVSPRTLQKHFRRFLRRAPRTFLRELRFERARRELLGGCEQTSVTKVATHCGFAHLGRFATEYHRRYGESRSTTLRRAQRTSTRYAPSPLVLTSAIERPTIAILPFEWIGPQPGNVAHLRTTLALPCGASTGSRSRHRPMPGIISAVPSVRRVAAVSRYRPVA